MLEGEGTQADETIILPVLARDEEPQPTTQESMFNYVRLSDGGRPRHPGPRSETSIIADVALGVLGRDGLFDWRLMKEHASIRQAIDKAAVEAALEALLPQIVVEGRTDSRGIGPLAHSHGVSGTVRRK